MCILCVSYVYPMCILCVSYVYPMCILCVNIADIELANKQIKPFEAKKANV